MILLLCQARGLRTTYTATGPVNSLGKNTLSGPRRTRCSPTVAPPGRRRTAQRCGRAPPQGAEQGGRHRLSSSYLGTGRTEALTAGGPALSQPPPPVPSRQRRLSGHVATAAGETPQGAGPPPLGGTGPLPPGPGRAARPDPPTPRGSLRRGGPERAGPGRALTAASRARRRPPRLTAPWGGAWPRMRRGPRRRAHRGGVAALRAARGRGSERRRAARPLSRRRHARPRGGAG